MRLIKDCALGIGDILEEVSENIERNTKLGFPLLSEPISEHLEHCAILGGGWSIEDTIDEAFSGNKTTVSIGSSHDAILELGYVPDIYVCIETLDSSMFLKNPNKKTKYYLSTNVHKNTIDSLKGYDVTLFHTDFGVGNVEDGMIVHGGSNVATRAAYLMHTLGYRFFHLFGCDSSYREEGNHFYKTGVKTNIIDVSCKDRLFKSSPQMLQQVFDVQKIIKLHSDFKFFVYGDGLLQHALGG